MATRIDNMLVYLAEVEQVDAALYNLWRRAKLNLNVPLRIELSVLRSMVLIVEEDDWVLVDAKQDDLPVLAWINFQDQGRSALHTPVTCTLNHYHFMAAQLRERVLALLFEELDQRLHFDRE
ncbi:MAG: hypothetical protein Q9N68_00800 [Gammaproteobacteria bacterium]|nr:hypothetical protein [Gammaproteobacteria bacterium]